MCECECVKCAQLDGAERQGARRGRGQECIERSEEKERVFNEDNLYYILQTYIYIYHTT